MWLRSTFDYYQFLLSFCDEIVGAELLHHVDPEILYRTQHRQMLGTGSRTRVSHPQDPPKFVDAICASSYIFTCFARYYFTVWPVVSTSPAKQKQRCNHLGLYLPFLLLVAQCPRLFGTKGFFRCSVCRLIVPRCCRYRNRVIWRPKTTAQSPF